MPPAPEPDLNGRPGVTGHSMTLLTGSGDIPEEFDHPGGDFPLAVILGVDHHGLAVDFDHLAEHYSLAAFERHRLPQAQVLEDIEILACSQFVDAAADEVVELQEFIEGEVVNAHSTGSRWQCMESGGGVSRARYPSAAAHH